MKRARTLIILILLAAAAAVPMVVSAGFQVAGL